MTSILHSQKTKNIQYFKKNLIQNIVRNICTKMYLPFNVKPYLGCKNLVVKRTMFTTRAANKVVNMAIIRPNTNSLANQLATTSTKRPYAVYTAYKYKSPIAKQYATDGSGKHIMQNKTICAETGCEAKTCPKPCDKIISSEGLGHYTHKPPTNSKSEHLSTYDIQGNTKNQHFVKSQNKPTMTSEDLKNLTEDDMIKDDKATNFCQSAQDIFDKITK